MSESFLQTTKSTLHNDSEAFSMRENIFVTKRCATRRVKNQKNATTFETISASLQILNKYGNNSELIPQYLQMFWKQHDLLTIKLSSRI